MKFSNKLSLAILITGVIVLIAVSYTIYKISYNSIIKSQLLYTKSVADEVSDYIDQLLSEKVKAALTLANTPIIKEALEKSNRSYDNLSDERRKESIKLQNDKWKSTKDLTDNLILKFTDNKVSHFLKNQQELLRGEYGEIFLTNKFGALVASTSKLSTFAHGYKYWWLGSYDNGRGAVFFDDRGYDDSVGGYVLGLVVPIRKGAEIIGILKCNLNILGSVSELISGAGLKLMGKFKLTRSGGMVVFEEGFEPLSTQIHDPIFNKMKSKNSESFIINDSGEKYLVGLSEISLTKGQKGYGFGGTFESIDHKKGNTGESWHVICYREMSVILAPTIESTKSIVLVGIAIILILVLVSYLFGRKIAQPLIAIGKATDEIGKGNFEYRIDTERNDEIGKLAHSFNSMASKLHQTTTTVELLGNEVKHRKQMEEDLRKNEKKYRLIVENQTDMIVAFDSEGFLLFVSPSYCKTFDSTEDELVGKRFMPLIHEDDRETVAKVMDIVHKPPYTAYVEERAMTKDGWRWQAWLNTAILNEEGKIESIVAVGRDINERKNIEDVLRESEDRYRELFDNMRSGVAVYQAVDGGENFIFVDYNRAGGQMDRKNRRDVIGRRVTEVFPGVIELGLHKVFKRVWKTGKPESHPLSIYKDGDLSQWRENFVYKLPSGEIVAVFTDETARMKAEEALRKSEKQASAALEAARGFTFSYDIASGKIEWDGSIEEITGYTPEEFAHVDIEGWAEKIHPNERDDMLSILEESVQRDRATAEYRFRIKCGDYIVVSSTSLTERDEKGLPVRLVGILRDITETKKIHAEAMRVGHLAALGELAAGVAHEINNPINGIISYAEILKDEFNDRGEDDDIPTRIIKEGDRVAEIVKNLLVFARDRKEEHSPTHIQGILSDALALVERQIAKDGIKLNVDVSPDLPKIKALSQEIQQVFLNIISNARYALNQRFPESHEDKVFEIRAETLEIEERNYVRIIFYDRGTGISARLLDRISEPFYSTKPKNEGTGLGLSISHGIIENHRGKLRFESVEGEYTKVMVDLPLNKGWEL